MKILKKIYPFRNKTDEEISKEFMEKYIKLSKKYNRDFMAVISLYKDEKEITDEKKINSIAEKLNKFLKSQKIGIVPKIRIINNDITRHS
jgi:predicted phage-related endonuclease